MTTPRFGFSRDKYAGDPEAKVIAKGLGSVKYMSDALAHQALLPTFMDVLKALSTTNINSRQLDILIKIDFFAAYGNSRELAYIVNLWNYFKQGWTIHISSDKIPDFLRDDFSKYATNINAKGKELKTWTITDMDGLLAACEQYIRDLGVQDVQTKVKMQNQKEYLGYIDLTTGKDEDRRKLWVMNVTPLKDKTTGEPWCYRVDTRSLGTGKTARLSISALVFLRTPIAQNDIIYAESLHKNRQGYWYLDKYHRVA